MIKNPPIIKKIVREMGGTIERVIPERGYFYIKFGDEKIFVSRKFKISSSLISGGEITKYKDLTYFILKENGIPTPKSICFYCNHFNESLFENIHKLKYPLVIKDAQGSNSKGVFTNIKNLDEAKKIITREMHKFRALLVQEMIFGKEFRILVLNKKVIGALELIPPRIFADGKSTIKELILKKQKKTEKKTPLDGALAIILKEQGCNLESVPEKNTEIFIRKNSCLAEGGETRDVTDLTSEDIKKVCIKATRVTEKNLAGIDIMCEDITKKMDNQFFSIIEINGKPDLYIHYNPTHGKTRNVVKEIIEFILKLRKNTAL